ncbi:hypothetical protein GCM10007276_10690 [Agaricicola taiwanensis]|uniref:Uncharacterized protein n=1 Tax=Agaricicola taiwanensis TaxID=591372 RepID=A0A8J2VNA5_9RHOB|nr:hypothetical protein GCM10007276_10690 [Agaricicola taiwanensis]
MLRASEKTVGQVGAQVHDGRNVRLPPQPEGKSRKRLVVEMDDVEALSYGFLKSPARSARPNKIFAIDRHDEEVARQARQGADFGQGMLEPHRNVD